MFERFGPGAESAGCGLVTAFGYDWVPGNLAGALALRDAGPAATRVEIGYFNPGAGASSMSGGTRASAAGVMLSAGFAWHGGRLVDEPGRHGRAFELSPGKQARAVSASSSEHFSLPRVHPTLRDVDVYLGWFGPASEPLRALSAVMAPVLKLPEARNSLDGLFARFVKGSTGGPDAAARATSRSLVVAEAYDAAGTRLADVRLDGVNGYDLTAGFLAWGAQTAAAGGLQGTGALGPVDGFGLDALEAGCAETGIAGFRRSRGLPRVGESTACCSALRLTTRRSSARGPGRETAYPNVHRVIVASAASSQLSTVRGRRTNSGVPGSDGSTRQPYLAS